MHTRYALEAAFQVGGAVQKSWHPPVLEVFIRDFLGKERSSRENQKQISCLSLARFRQAPQRNVLVPKSWKRNFEGWKPFMPLQEKRDGRKGQEEGRREGRRKRSDR